MAAPTQSTTSWLRVVVAGAASLAVNSPVVVAVVVALFKQPQTHRWAASALSLVTGVLAMRLFLLEITAAARLFLAQQQAVEVVVQPVEQAPEVAALVAADRLKLAAALAQRGKVLTAAAALFMMAAV
jgi:hypothetical protein